MTFSTYNIPFSTQPPFIVPSLYLFVLWLGCHGIGLDMLLGYAGSKLWAQG